MQQKQGFDPPRRPPSMASTNFGGDPTDITDEEINQLLMKRVQRCSMLAMELVHGRSLQLPEMPGMYVLTSRAWVDKMQRKEVWYEEKQQQYYEPPVKKVKLKRKRVTKPDPNDEKKAEKAAATGHAQPAVHPPPEMQVSQDIIPAPDPQVFGVKYMFGTPGGRGVARG